MSIITDTSIKLGISEYRVFLRAYESLKVAAPDSFAREDFKRYAASNKEFIEDEVVDFCLTVLAPRKEPHDSLH